VTIKLALPAGSLKESTFALMKKAGFVISGTSRSYYPTIDDPEIELMLVRAQEIPRYVESGALDAGLTGADWTRENRAKVEYVAELIYASSGSFIDRGFRSTTYSITNSHHFKFTERMRFFFLRPHQIRKYFLRPVD